MRGEKILVRVLSPTRPLVAILGQSRDRQTLVHLAQFAHVRCLYLQRQVTKLVSGLLHYWSLLCNNMTVVKLQMFTSSYGSRRFVACDQGFH